MKLAMTVVCIAQHRPLEQGRQQLKTAQRSKSVSLMRWHHTLSAQIAYRGQCQTLSMTLTLKLQQAAQRTRCLNIVLQTRLG